VNRIEQAQSFKALFLSNSLGDNSISWVVTAVCLVEGSMQDSRGFCLPRYIDGSISCGSSFELPSQNIWPGCRKDLG
jgi:hypothetical protein